VLKRLVILVERKTCNAVSNGDGECSVLYSTGGLTIPVRLIWFRFPQKILDFFKIS